MPMGLGAFLDSGEHLLHPCEDVVNFEPVASGHRVQTTAASMGATSFLSWRQLFTLAWHGHLPECNYQAAAGCGAPLRSVKKMYGTIGLAAQLAEETAADSMQVAKNVIKADVALAKYSRGMEKKLIEWDTFATLGGAKPPADGMMSKEDVRIAEPKAIKAHHMTWLAIQDAQRAAKHAAMVGLYSAKAASKIRLSKDFWQVLESVDFNHLMTPELLAQQEVTHEPPGLRTGMSGASGRQSEGLWCKMHCVPSEPWDYPMLHMSGAAVLSKVAKAIARKVRLKKF
mmetsp:Transcript_27380/g.63906  ORF Transcript_27380/g.63906 Transcript_27380/m.63906 type:complete len:285 (-) Transcript_27380:52-906(-)